jgi:TolA-binding protein
MSTNCPAKVILVLCAVLAQVSGAENREYEYARDAFKKGNYAIARIYFENIMQHEVNRDLFPDALYHLTLIHDREDDFVGVLSSAGRFLENYDYDLRSKEILAMVVRELVDRSAYRVAYEYIEKYNFLITDSPILEELGRNLLEGGEPRLADYVLSFAVQSDTIKILRAMTMSDLLARGKVLESLNGMTRDLYLAENHLLRGDTVSAFLSFRNLNGDRYKDGALYRYTKLAVLFAPDDAASSIERLRPMNGFGRKSDLLYAMLGNVRLPRFLPEDAEENALFLQICSVDTVFREPLEGVSLDSILKDTEDTLAQIRELRKQYRNSYFVDSVYCHQLMTSADYEQASRVISDYLRYQNTERYARRTMAYYQFAQRDFDLAAKNIILSDYRNPAASYILAECLRKMGHDSADLFEYVMSHTADSALHSKAVKGYVLERYGARAYDDVSSIGIDELAADTALIRVYARSLARCGLPDRADSLVNAYFDHPDYEIVNLYGQYLMDKEQYDRAKTYYDSVLQDTPAALNEDLYYNWAMAYFLSNEMDTALNRFRSYVSQFPGGGNYHRALFKIATLNYLDENYDSAGYYYGLASEDDELAPDGLENQIISYKKAGNWQLVIETGERMLNRIGEDKQADVRFEIGYAALRAGRVHEAIENLEVAARAKSEPSYHYWLGEAYLGKGDFARAFHSYQKIVHEHPDDEMWVPTARYKTGITLELMDEIDAAKEVYKQIIRERGVNDPIGAEANLRLDFLNR